MGTKEQRNKFIKANLLQIILIPIGLTCIFILPLFVFNDLVGDLLSIAISLHTIVFSIYSLLFDYNKTQFNEIKTTCESGIKDLIKHANIIYQPSMSAYDQTHVDILRQMVQQLIKKNHNPKIYAIDHSLPLEWWNESMTAYLAILSNYRYMTNINEPHSTENLVTRIFIFNESDLLNPLTVKTLFIHLEYGFRTIVYSYKSFMEIFRKYNSSGIFLPREVIIWENEKVDINIEGRGDFNDTQGYQSYWSLEHGRTQMNEIKNNLREAKGGKIPLVNKYGLLEDTNILFDIFKEEHYNQHIDFIKNHLLKDSNLTSVKSIDCIQTSTTPGVELVISKPDNKLLEEILNQIKINKYGVN